MRKKIRKNYCDVGKKWCKFLRKGVCNFSGCELCDIVKCPRIAEIETVTLYDLIREVNFDEVFSCVVATPFSIGSHLAGVFIMEED